GARLADRGHAGAKAVFQRPDVMADLLAGDRFRKKEPVGGENAQRNTKQRMKRSDHVAQRIVVDEILQAYVVAQREGLQVVIERYARGFVLAHGLPGLSSGAPGVPPSAARRS